MGGPCEDRIIAPEPHRLADNGGNVDGSVRFETPPRRPVVARAVPIQANQTFVIEHAAPAIAPQAHDSPPGRKRPWLHPRQQQGLPSEASVVEPSRRLR